ncbi:MAG: family 43 glycosylhydrolase [Bifidobacteriaceae bacterium]|jgi:hypothetical protein|nr:family 43 glycosylhydrolase [Bifidobacteriaceae bacterium]
MEPTHGRAANPFLPGGEYLPDPEPHVFGGRVYVYGSHDRFGAPMFCVNDYVCWSAPCDDLSAWRYEGVIYRKKQDPKNRLGLRLLFAPDVAQGTDGRFYLYYAFDFWGVMGVAVASQPAGPYEFLGHVSHPDGTVWGRKAGDPFPFDPGVLVDADGRVYLYSGFCKPVPAIITGTKKLRFDGGYVVELEPDMVTLRGPERLLFPKRGEGSFAGHEFFEASSIRKYGDAYYFVYSSRLNHELCYAVSDSPTGGFRFGGTLISNGDIGLPGHPDEARGANYTGNNHGGMLRLGDQFYIFYHRHTNRTSYARQACAEPLTRQPGGGFEQAELTSCGLNGGPLRGAGLYQARIACNLWSGGGAGRYDGKAKLGQHPYLTQDGRDGPPGARQYIANLRDGATAGFKYFDLSALTAICATVRGKASGQLVVSTDADGRSAVAIIDCSGLGEKWASRPAAAQAPDGRTGLFFTFRGAGAVDFLDFSLTAEG